MFFIFALISTHWPSPHPLSPCMWWCWCVPCVKCCWWWWVVTGTQRSTAVNCPGGSDVTVSCVCVMSKQQRVFVIWWRSHTPPQTPFDPSPTHSELRLLLHRPSSNSFLKLTLKKKQAYFEFCSFSIKVLNQVFSSVCTVFFLEYVSRLLPNCGLHTYSIFVPPHLHFSVVCNG